MKQYPLDNDAPALYVTTYAKYNSGYLSGEWVILTDFSDFDSFISYCRNIHSDEEDAELMFTAYEYLPDSMYHECAFSEEDFDNVLEMYNCADKEAAYAYYEYFGEWDLRRFEDAYQGYFSTEYDFAVQLIDDCYDLDKQMGSLSYYFDYDRFARDLFAYDYTFVEGYVFLNY